MSHDINLVLLLALFTSMPQPIMSFLVAQKCSHVLGGREVKAKVTGAPLLFANFFEVASGQVMTSLQCILTLWCAATVYFEVFDNPALVKTQVPDTSTPFEVAAAQFVKLLSRWLGAVKITLAVFGEGHLKFCCASHGPFCHCNLIVVMQ